MLNVAKHTSERESLPRIYSPTSKMCLNFLHREWHLQVFFLFLFKCTTSFTFSLPAISLFASQTNQTSALQPPFTASDPLASSPPVYGTTWEKNKTRIKTWLLPHGKSRAPPFSASAEGNLCRCCGIVAPWCHCPGAAPHIF